jgi:hypothetical protein
MMTPARQSPRAPLPAAAALSLAALAAAAVTLVAAAPLSAQCRAYGSITLPEVGAIMRSMGYDVKDPAPGKSGELIWSLAGDTAFVVLIDPKTIAFYNPVIAMRKKVTPEAINSWNSRRPFTRAYTDEFGDYMLKLELSLEGGVCEERIKDFMRTCEGAWRRWITDVLGGTP